MKSLNQKGFAHWILPVLVVVVIAAIGTYVLTASHADPCKPGRVPVGSMCFTTQNGCQTPAPLSSQCPKSAVVPKTSSTTLTAAKQAAATKKAAAKAKATAKKRGNDNYISQTAATPPNPPTTQTAVADSSIQSSIPPSPPSTPRGDIFIVTYLKGLLAGGAAQAKDKAGRIGNVKIKIARSGANEMCLTHSSLNASTNSTAYQTVGGQKLFTEGTLHFIGCQAGTYTVTALGRTKYKAQGQTTVTFTLNDNETKRISFTYEAAD